MQEFIEKLIGRFKSEQNYTDFIGIKEVIEIVNQLAEEYNNDFCEWKYDGIMYDRCPHTETLFARIHNCDEKIFKYCPYCGKKIKVVE